MSGAVLVGMVCMVLLAVVVASSMSSDSRWRDAELEEVSPASGGGEQKGASEW